MLPVVALILFLSVCVEKQEVGPIVKFLKNNISMKDIPVHVPKSIKNCITKKFRVSDEKIFSMAMLESDRVESFVDESCDCVIVLSSMQIESFGVFGVSVGAENVRFVFQVRNRQIILDDVVVVTTLL
ncbi:hypothetical protein [Denitrobaculum tricleocarpae]|uniref:Uncharacterized protein n=1 Tax=Denitrobaculum tricleocarpae TaxID=2591009 RepID=A0A545TP84_9PROT|nr:hypothetical protein [Denitrobaculum tricleocarpae]TQV79036.1 hypothetical protein FKG95_15240 [Denitrobaculum tricleocarpae]